MRLLMRLLAALILVLTVPLSGVAAGSETASYDYLIGEGFVCGLPVPSACPDVAVAPSGDTVELTGSGTLSIHPKSASGSGDFSHFDAEGDLVAAGTWTATDLISFHFYGCVDLGGGFIVCGGQALVRVELTAGTLTFPGTLTIDCEFGDKIPSGAVEGVTLNVPGVIHFNKSVSGLTVFTPD